MFNYSEIVKYYPTEMLTRLFAPRVFERETLPPLRISIDSAPSAVSCTTSQLTRPAAVTSVEKGVDPPNGMDVCPSAVVTRHSPEKRTTPGSPTISMRTGLEGVCACEEATVETTSPTNAEASEPKAQPARTLSPSSSD